ncbi:MAG: hypothetical protein R3Y35_12175 [Clostridia bacterium]
MAFINPILNLCEFDEFNFEKHSNFLTIYLCVIKENANTWYSVLCDVLNENLLSEVIVKSDETFPNISYDYICKAYDESGELEKLFLNIQKSNKARYTIKNKEIFIINDTITMQNIKHLLMPLKLHMTKGFDEYFITQDKLSNFKPLLIYI